MRPAPAKKRQGFTLIELLVVIGIIAVLSAMGAGAYFATVKRQKYNNSRAGLQALDGIVKQHWNQVIDDAKKESIPDELINSPIFGLSADPYGRQRARVIWIKLRLMEAFPASFAEIVNPWPYANNLIPTGRRKYVASYRSMIASVTPKVDEAESSACLFLALSVDRSGAKKVDKDALGAAYFFDTNGDGIDELVDGYKKAIRFFRFPTGNTELHAANPNKTGKSKLFADPLDADGLLLKWTGGARNNFDSFVHPVGTGTAQAFYMTPVLVSAGLDEQFGLQDKTMLVTNAAQADDNLYSFKLQQ